MARRPDVLALQELKCTSDAFPREPIEALGYTVEALGDGRWNGVALLSRLPMTDVRRNLIDQPVYEGSVEPRAIGATIDGVRVWSVYVPNGRELDHPHYAYKLEWLHGLARDTTTWMSENPDVPLALMGDWNVAPYDHDVWDVREFEGSTHVSALEREAFFAFEAIGLKDVVRERVPEGYTYWDYKQLRFPKDEGLRIDFIMGSPAFAELVESAEIVRDERKGEGPSDHVPVVVTLTGEDDDRPMFL